MMTRSAADVGGFFCTQNHQTNKMEERIWNFSIRQSTFSKFWSWLLAPVWRYGASSTFWKVTGRITLRQKARALSSLRYRTETSTDPETGETTTEEVPYEYYILNVTLTNKTLPAVILPRLNEQQREIYTVMQQLKGNKPYLWEGIYNGGEDTGPSYEIPGEALDDPAFAALMEEATKYIGWPYVWGGSSPSTSFDCSGFVCWVYTASGVHNLPRTTAQGIYNQCAIISPSEAKPGDIIFFTGTYDSPGPVSHVGIYVGDGMMLHCGSPIQYANINSSYWQTHFYAFGRL